MVLTSIKKLRYSVLYVTGMYLRDITDMILSVLHLSVSHPSVCSSCFTLNLSSFGQQSCCFINEELKKSGS